MGWQSILPGSVFMLQRFGFFARFVQFWPYTTGSTARQLSQRIKRAPLFIQSSWLVSSDLAVLFIHHTRHTLHRRLELILSNDTMV